jgi:uncharacterized protein DUF1488
MPLRNGKILTFSVETDHVQFEMEDGTEIVSCSVTLRYLLLRSARSGRASRNVREIFISLRPEIEALASRKYDEGEVHPHITEKDI